MEPLLEVLIEGEINTLFFAILSIGVRYQEIHPIPIASEHAVSNLLSILDYFLVGPSRQKRGIWS